MITNICVLRSGGEYKPEHVIRLSKQVPDLVCISDVTVKGVRTIPLLHGWQNWWCKIELFRPDIKGDLFYLDLDTTVIKMPKMPQRDTVLNDFGLPTVIASGLMYLTENKRAEVWELFNKNPLQVMKEHEKWGVNRGAGDGGFLQQFYKGAQRWQKIAKVYSYKIHCKKGIPDDADIICYHGYPKPWHLENEV